MDATCRSRLRPIRLHRYLEPRSVERANRLGIELQEWLASGAHDERARARVRGPRPA